MSMQLGLDQVGQKKEVTTPPFRLAMLGMISGNGHPYSWSAIVNGFEANELDACPYPIIVDYLSRQLDAGMEHAAVTHIWSDNPADAAQVARFAKIPHVVEAPQDVIGEVDAVIIAVDDGDDHVERARPFVEAGLPVLVDKPLATNVEDLRTFVSWRRSGAQILSSSGMRYASELNDLKGISWDWMSVVLSNSWKRYGIHFLEPVYTLTGPGYLSIRSFEEGPNQYVSLRHSSGQLLTLSFLREVKLPFGTFHVSGKDGQKAFHLHDTYGAFRRQLLAFVDYAMTGHEPYPFSETIELMVIILAGIESTRRNGAEINLSEFQKNLAL